MSNGEENAGCKSIMLQESGSTVKHVNWVWPSCLVGNGGANNDDCAAGGNLDDCLSGVARGPYNVSLLLPLYSTTNGARYHSMKLSVSTAQTSTQSRICPYASPMQFQRTPNLLDPRYDLDVIFATIHYYHMMSGMLRFVHQPVRSSPTTEVAPSRPSIQTHLLMIKFSAATTRVVTKSSTLEILAQEVSGLTISAHKEVVQPLDIFLGRC